ncbi:MAG: hypothetical protein AABX05_01490 [Nanoarchaeota archaeon]
MSIKKNNPSLKEIERIAKETLNEFYIKRYKNQPKIDLKNIRVQIEEFRWENSSYRIDLFLRQKPSFIPYHKNFWMAHRLFMTKTGKTIKHDQIYTAWANHPDRKEEKNEKVMGFFPGNDYFKPELNFIDKILKKQPVKVKGDGLKRETRFMLKFKNGIEDLEKFEAEIIQCKEFYQITFEAEKYPGNEQFNLSVKDRNFSFKISKNGEISEASTFVKPYYGLQ